MKALEGYWDDHCVVGDDDVDSGVVGHSSVVGNSGVVGQKVVVGHSGLVGHPDVVGHSGMVGEEEGA